MTPEIHPAAPLTVDDLVDRWLAAWSGREPEAFTKLCVAGVHYEDPLTEAPLEGVGAIGAHAQRLWDAFPDARLQTSGARLTDGRFVAAPCRLLATHRGSVEGLPRTGRFVVVHLVFYLELRHDRVLRGRAFFDLYEAAVQLGVLPARGTVGERALMALRGFGVRMGRPPAT